jgi:radical SAM superfamily enzyme YgiQ (UPF0313 family)
LTRARRGSSLAESVDVLLVNPNREQMPWPVIPVGLCIVATALERSGHGVEVLDLSFSKDPARDVRAALKKARHDVVAITVRNLDNCNFEHPEFFLPEIRDAVVGPVRELLPRAKLVIGGAAVNVSPGDIFDYLGADYAVVGEGELAMPALLRALERGEDPSRLQGVLVRGGVRATLPILDTGRPGRGEPTTGRAVASDLSADRSRAFRFVDLPRYTALGAPYPIQTKRGCALKCTYCVYNNIEGHAYRLRQPRDVVDEIEEAVAHGARHFEIVDSTFNLPLAHARALCAELEARKLPIELSTMGLNPAAVGTELVLAMKRAGFGSVMCTPESACDVTLETLAKGFTKAHVLRAANALRAAQMPTWWFFLIGAPGETIDTVRETLAFCEEHVAPTDMVLFATGLRVYAGTPLERHCKQTGWFAADDPLFEPSWYLSPELDLDELYDLLVNAAEAHPNWMTNAETVVSPTMATVMKRAFRVVGWRGPFWLHLPKVHRWVSRIGARQRGLAAARESLRRVKNVQHHR